MWSLESPASSTPKVCDHPAILLVLTVTLTFLVVSTGHASDLVHEQTLGAPSPGPSHWFGLSVATTGTVCVVGEPRNDDLGNLWGAVHVYRDAPSGWQLEQTLRASDGFELQRFGYTVAVSGDRIAVGTLPEGGLDRQVYIYEFDGSAWSETAILGELVPGSGFGQQVDLDSDHLIVAAENALAAYVFRADPSGAWSLEATLTSADPLVSQYGWDVAIEGDVALVSALSSDDARGWVYAYRRVGVVWTFETLLTAFDAEPGDSFGFSVDIDGDVIAIGAANRRADPMTPSAGGVYVFRDDGFGWSFEQQLTASDAVPFRYYGYSVAVRADVLAVGAATDITPGRVYAYRRSATEWTDEQLLQSPDADDGDVFGGSIGLAGNVLLVGEVGAFLAFEEAGKAEIFRFATEFVRGDSNADGMVDVADAVFALSALFIPGSPPPDCTDSADSNDDGVFDIGDGVFLLSVLFGMSATLPAPHPGCGLDPTDDGLGCDAFGACP